MSVMEPQLKEAGIWLKAFLEAAPDFIYIKDAERRNVMVNQAYLKFLGLDEKSVLGKRDEEILPADLAAQCKAGDEKVLREGTIIRAEEYIVDAQGVKRFFETIKAPIYDEAGRVIGLLGISRDITERKRLEAEKSLFESRLTELNEYANRLNNARSLRELYGLILDAVEKMLGRQPTSIFIADENRLRMVAQRGYAKRVELTLPLDSDGEAVTLAARRMEPIVFPYTRSIEGYVKAEEDVLSELAVPMKVKDKVIGVLDVKRGVAFSQEDLKLMEILASHAAMAIINIKGRESLAALNAYGRNLVKARTMKEICNLTFKAANKILGFKNVSLLLIEEDKLKQIASCGADFEAKLELPLNSEKGVTVKAAKTGKTIYVPDVNQEPLYVKGGVLDACSELAVPIKTGTTTIGVLNIESRKPEAFNMEDIKRLELLASNVAIAISNLRRREALKRLSKNLENLIKSSTEIMQTPSLRGRLRILAKTIQKFGWRKVAISIRDEASGKRLIITAGLTKDEKTKLPSSTMGIPKEAWEELLSPKFDKYKIGELYYLPWNEPWIIKHIYGGKLIEGYDKDWLISPIRLPDGRVIGFISMREPVDGGKPTREDLIPLELFLHNAAVAIENAKLIKELETASKTLERYAENLERKVEDRTRKILEVQEKLLKAQRLAVIGELAGMVGHDLRNPLTSISAATYYLKKRLAQTADQKIMTMINLIERNIAYSNKIVNDLLDYSREVKLELAETTPKKLVEEALTHVEIPSSITLITEADDNVKITVDQDKMKRVFINLIKNAIEAMPKGGTLTITGRQIGGEIKFTFSDTGEGMTKEVLQNLWNPLFTTKAKGMGFGLAICKRFVEAHEGSITVESIPGKGTTFTVKIPIQSKGRKGGEKA